MLRIFSPLYLEIWEGLVDDVANIVMRVVKTCKKKYESLLLRVFLV